MNDLVEVVLKAFDEDVDGASILVDEAVSNYVMDLLEDNDELIQLMAADDVEHRTRIAKAALGRAYVEAVSVGEYPDASMRQYAQWLAGVEEYVDEVRKSFLGFEEWEVRGKKKRRYVARDPQGKFSRILDTRRTASVMGMDPSRISPAISSSSLLVDGQYADSVTDEDKRKMDSHQGQWDQASRHVADIYREFRGDSKGVQVVINRLTGGNQSDPIVFDLKDAREGIPASAVLGSNINPLDDTLLSVDIRTTDDAPEATVNRVARFNSFGYVGGDPLTTSMDRSGFSQAFGMKDIERPGTDRLFERLRGASSVLSASGMPKAAMFAGLVGDLGPEAERVLGPYVRQSAYRYRGTERTPDADLLADFKSQDMKAVRAISDGRVDESVLGDEPLLRGSGPVIGSYRARRRDAKGDQLKLQVQSDVAASHLIRTLPTDQMTARLSAKSGHVLPSQGILIDADGKVVSQAVGYADDHYLPFNLGNLMALRGGQYVRTRVTGGLTGEDVYAAVQSGARMVTVVSTSGVFSMELDPDFRGARGNSDKARQMYMRYLKILDAVEGSGLYLKDVSPAVKLSANQYADSMVASIPASEDREDKRREFYDRYLEERRRDAQYLKIDQIEQFETQAREQAEGDYDWARLNPAQQARRIEDKYDEIKHANQTEGVQQLQLNAAGYDMALRTLQQQFPYFIRNVSYQPLSTGRMGAEGSGFLDSRGLNPALGSALQSANRRDDGYVVPGGLRPSGVESGFYRNPSRMEMGSKRPSNEGRSSSQGGGAGESAGAGGTASAGGIVPSAPTSDMAASPLMQRWSRFSKPTQDLANTALTNLMMPLGALPANPSIHATWEEAAATRNKAAMVAFLLQDQSQMTSRIGKDPDADRALMDENAVRTALLNTFGPGLTDDGLQESSALSDALGGAKTSSEAVKFIADRLRVAVQAASLSDPLVPESADPFQESMKPQAIKDITALATQEDLKRFAETARGKAIASIESGLGRDIDRVAPEMIKDLKIVSEKTKAAAEESGMDPDRMPQALARLAGLDVDRLKALLGTEILGGGAWSPSALEARARQVQSAWTLSRVRQMIDWMEDPGGGSPKVQPLPEALQPQVAKARVSSSRLVPVLPRDHPLAVDVLLRKATGRPLLPNLPNRT